MYRSLNYETPAREFRNSEISTASDSDFLPLRRYTGGTMRICFFGDYDPDYNRTRVLAIGLEKLGVEVVHCTVSPKHPFKLLTLWRKLRIEMGQCDLVMVPMSNGRFFTLVARLATSRPVFWDPVFSLYDNWVSDRRLVSPHHPKAFLYWFLDLLSAIFADMIVLDNASHVAFWKRVFRVSDRKLSYVFIGADDAVFRPQPFPKTGATFEVEFHGNYIPLQGPQNIVRAAKLLEEEDVHFTMIGKGQECGDTEQLARELGVKNITFLPFLPQRQVAEYMAKAHVCMGHSGDRPRVVRSLPNKLYEAAAMGRVSINVDVASIREVFTPGVDIVGIRPGDPEDLARAVRELKESGRVEEMGRAAYQAYIKTSTPDILGKKLKAIIDDYFRRTRCA